jgi:hypothetical protein
MRTQTLAVIRTRRAGRDTHVKPAWGHSVVCPYCATAFDLFAAPWCLHYQEPSKLCPSCERCLCEHPAYGEPHFWKQAPTAFLRHGFKRLFLFYL